MDPLIEAVLNESQTKLRRLKRIAITYKMAFLLALLGGVCYVYLRIYTPRTFHCSADQAQLYFLVAYLLVALPFLLQSPFSFLPARYLDEINGILKQRITGRELAAYPAHMHLYPDSSLDEDLLFDIGLISDRFKFAYGDDYFQGEFNGFRASMSEFHVRGFLRPLFDGFVAKIHLPENRKETGDLTIVQDWFKKRFGTGGSTGEGKETVKLCRSLIQECEGLAFVAVRGNHLYLGVKGNTDMFEYSFGRLDRDKAKYESDIEVFACFLKYTDLLTKSACFR